MIDMNLKQKDAFLLRVKLIHHKMNLDLLWPVDQEVKTTI